MIFLKRVGKGVFIKTAIITARAEMTNAAEEAGQRLMEKIK